MARIHLPATLVLGLCTAIGGAARAATADATVTVHATGFAWSGQTFTELAALEATLMPRAPRSVALVACGSDALPAWKAAAHGFRHLALELAVADAGDPLCRGGPAPALVPATRRSGGTEAAVQWWARLQP